ncbi:MAG: D-alanine--D-alanine ligase [Candidatus Eisenbacteria bacterium]
MNIVVLMGGTSAEREISLRTGSGIARALRARGHEVTALDSATGAVLLPGAEGQTALAPAGDAAPPQGAVALALARRRNASILGSTPLRDAELVFIALHGGAGEDGTIQALLDLAGKTYTGSGMLASAMAMDKAVSKRIFEHAGIPTPAWRLYRRREGIIPDAAAVEAIGGFPVVVKPNDEGSTFGLTIVEEPAGLAAAYDAALHYSDQVLLEAFIPGRELTVAVLGDQVLPVIEIRPKSGLYDFESKYTAGKSEYFCPADLPAAKAHEIQDLALRTCRALDTAGVARVDFRLAPDGTPYCLELNTIPGMTPTSLVPMAAQAVGMSFEDLCERIAALALARAGGA